MVVFQNKGLIDLKAITTFGVCVKPKTKNPIGYFGTGLKYAIAVLLRENQTVTLWYGTKKIKFTTKKRKIRGRPFRMVQMNGEDLPFTTELGKNWELWMAYRELAANAMDEPETVIAHEGIRDTGAGRTTFIVEGDAIEDIHECHHEIFLATRPRYAFDTVELHDGVGVGKFLYYRGIKVHELPKQAMFNYNILSKVKLTEDRTIPNIYAVYHAIARAILKCDNAGLIRMMLEANQRWWESTIDYNLWDAEPGKTFNQIVAQYYHTGISYNRSAKALYDEHTPQNPPPVLVQWETIPMEKRRKLWAALMFWEKLGIEIPRDTVRVTDALGGGVKGTAQQGMIYLALHVLDRDMRQVAGIIYSLYAQGKHKGAKDEVSLLIDTIVDFGERILGLQQRDVA